MKQDEATADKETPMRKAVLDRGHSSEYAPPPRDDLCGKSESVEQCTGHHC